MARTTRDPEGKRKQVGVRFGPQDRATLEALAKAEGADVSVGKLIEKRTLALMSADKPTFDLLAAICARISEAQEVAKKAHPANQQPDELRWHQDLYGWAAVAEMLARGPIEERRPESIVTDEGYKAAERTKLQIVGKKKAIMERLSQHGISASLEPSRESEKRGGLFGRVLEQYDRRGPERAMIDAIPDDESRQAAISLHDELKALDEAEAQESEHASDTVKIFREMEEVGRRLFREHNSNQRFSKMIAGLSALPKLAFRKAG